MKTLIPLLLLLVSMPTLAQRQFDIEVLIFKRAVNPEQVNESWPNALPEINVTKARLFQDNEYRAQKGVEMLAREEYALLSEKERIAKHAGFDVLLHTAWRQGDEGKAAAPVFRIQAGKDYSSQFNADGRSKADTPAQPEAELAIEGIQEENIDLPLFELDGKLQIYVQHYLYAETTLDLKAPSVREVVLEDKPLEIVDDGSDSSIQLGHLEEISPTVRVESFLKSYRMEQKRKMRSTETHYLDHPLLGMIIQVRRVAAE